MKSSTILVAVACLFGLTAYATAQLQQCSWQCTSTGNGTDADTIQININGKTKWILSKSLSVSVIIKGDIAYGFDLNAKLTVMLKKGASGALVIQGTQAVYVKIDFSAVFSGDLTVLRKVFDQASSQLSAGGSGVVNINFQYIYAASFNFGLIFSGSASVVASIRADYAFWFEAYFKLVASGAISASYGIAGIFIICFESVNSVTLAIVGSINVMVTKGYQISVTFIITLFGAIKTGTEKAITSLQFAIQASADFTSAISAFVRGDSTSVVKVVTFLGVEYKFAIERLSDSFQISFETKLSGKIILAYYKSINAYVIYNSKANFALIYVNNTFILFNFKQNAGIIVQGSYIAVFSGSDVASGEVTLALLVSFSSQKALTIYAEKKVELRAFVSAIQSSQASFIAFIGGSSTAAIAIYKGFSGFFASYTSIGIITYSFNYSYSFQFALGASSSSSFSVGAISAVSSAFAAGFSAIVTGGGLISASSLITIVGRFGISF